jgi:hypothetical protein
VPGLSLIPTSGGGVDQETLETAVAAALVGYTMPELELGYAEKTATQTSTNVTPGSVATGAAGGLITGLAMDVIGNGRPVDLKFTGLIWHSTANTLVGVYFIIDGVSTGYIETENSPSTTAGKSLRVERRLTIPEGVTRNVQVGIYGTVAGTCTLFGSSAIPATLSAVSR